MRPTETSYDELITRYLEEGMDAAEKQHFEAELSHNKKLKLALNLHREIHKVITNEGQMHFREKLDAVYQELFGGRGGSLLRLDSRGMNHLLIAASIITIVGLTFFFKWVFREGNPEMAEQNIPVMADSTMNQAADTSIRQTPNESLRFRGHYRPPGEVFRDNKDLLAADTKSPARRKVKPEELMAEAYQLQPDLVNLLKAPMRAVGFTLLEPQDSMIYPQGEAITFKWKTGIQQPLYLEIINRHNKVIEKVALPEGGEWKWEYSVPGIYIFRIRTINRPYFYSFSVIN
ncbi:hypothetical protein ACFL6I_22930 [candidate division KSB1 bacterium]